MKIEQTKYMNSALLTSQIYNIATENRSQLHDINPLWTAGMRGTIFLDRGNDFSGPLERARGTLGGTIFSAWNVSVDRRNGKK